MAVFKTFAVLTVLITLLTTTLHGHRYDDWQDARMHPSFKEEKYTRRQFLAREGEDTNEFWLDLGKQFVKQQKQQQQNTNVAKNVIMFLGDGMGLTTLVAARNYIGGEHTKLAFEEFPYVGLSKTYSVDKTVPDSATTATAYLCGVKGNFGTIGVNAAISLDDCQAMKNSSDYVYSIAKWAMDKGKSAGFVTTARVTHASPAGVYAHTADRNWESDADIEEACGVNHGLADIAQQLIHGEVGSRLKVMMGGGKNAFVDKSLDGRGWRTDGRNLIEEYQQQSPSNRFVATKEELNNLDFSKTDRLLGIFNDDHVDYHLETVNDAANTQPTLQEMTAKAIEFLEQQNDKGYFLFVEGARIDMAHHETMARLAVDETKEFSETVNYARQKTSSDDTLIVVTADHSHAFSVAGYQDRGSDIFSLMKKSADGLPHEPLSYANGNGYNKHFDVANNRRVNPQQVLTGDIHDLFPATVPLASETHGGEDVAVFASGPWAHLFTSVYEQNAIPHMMAYAACIGDGLQACDVLEVNKKQLRSSRT